MTEAAATENEQDLYEAQLDLLLDPNDPRVIEQALRDGIPADWLDAAKRSPVYALAKKYKVALPLHPEYRTMPMVWYIPPLSPVVDALRETGNDAEDAGNLFGALNALRIPIEYLAELFTAGDVVPVKKSLGVLAAMRAFMRDNNLGNPTDASKGHNYREDVSVWFRSLFYLDPQGQLMADAPLAFRIHALAGMALFIVWPFTRLVHAFSAPFGYAFRPYIVYRDRGPHDAGNGQPHHGRRKSEGRERDHRSPRAGADRTAPGDPRPSTGHGLSWSSRWCSASSLPGGRHLQRCSRSPGCWRTRPATTLDEPWSIRWRRGTWSRLAKRELRDAVPWVVLAGVPSLVLLVLRPWLIWVGVVLAVLWAVSVWLTRAGHERGAGNDLLLVAQAAIAVPLFWAIATDTRTWASGTLPRRRHGWPPSSAWSSSPVRCCT